MLFFMDGEDEYFVLGLGCAETKCRHLSNTKETNEAPSALLSYNHAGILKNTREVLEKLEPQASASCTWSVRKNSQVLI